MKIEELSSKIHTFSGLFDDSRKVTKGSVFVAIDGENSSVDDHIKEAVRNGASVIVGKPKNKISNLDYVETQDPREALGKLASKFYGEPTKHLKIIGVTGTKGKTTTSMMIQHILNKMGAKTGLVSTISARIGDKEIDTGSHVTSPGVLDLYRLFRLMVDEKCKYAVIEVSSHGIAQKRIAGVNFEVAVLTHIAPEHLDYHKTFKEYKRVKMSFVNSALHKVISQTKTSRKTFPGEFNNLNADSAVKVASILGFDKKDIESAILSFKLPSGRLEEIKNDLGIKIIVDFAHTPDSLRAVLGYLRTLTKSRLISVFGCAGERDIKKRRKMGKISSDIADISIFTAEDPRTENLQKIIRYMKKDARNYVSIPERGEAIAYALSIAKKGDVVAFLGKGHETTMAYKGFEHGWNENSEILNFLNRNKKLSAIILAAGKGTRMKSYKPKILHEICGRPMISYSLQNLRRAKIGEIVAVVSYRKNLVVNHIGGAVKVAVQKNPKGGTANATSYGLREVSDESKDVMVLYGDDTAFYEPRTINSVVDEHYKEKSVLTFVTLIKDDPSGLGRIIRNKNGQLMGIVEEKDATDEQRKIKEVNDGLYIFNKDWLNNNLPKIKKSPVTGELYLVDLIKMAIDQGKKVIAHTLLTDVEWQGINTPEQLVVAQEKMKERLKSI